MRKRIVRSVTVSFICLCFVRVRVLRELYFAIHPRAETGYVGPEVGSRSQYVTRYDKTPLLQDQFSGSGHAQEPQGGEPGNVSYPFYENVLIIKGRYRHV